ncbi:DNA (cytosine-5)-methyltransferase [Cymbomonas tetramitiformis]|uniref:DNA (Cytosine-5)-methyltransferase n=1 Tax=Cymbomonas tetramitiformis TaxID=36881 RepID=A0AAE0G6L5_9CHLO|nr:DNA (cytosine-5)-methyltransferase [Cymbomonas tetramitiformis]
MKGPEACTLGAAEQDERALRRDESFAKHAKRIKSMNLIPDPKHDDGSCMVLDHYMAEAALGFPKGHLDGYGSVYSTDTQKRSWIGDSFCIRSVMHCMPLWSALQKEGRWAPGGAVALSLFDGIGGGPVAVHDAGIKVRIWIIVEKEKLRTKITEAFLEQKGFTSITRDDFMNTPTHIISRLESTYVVFQGEHAIEEFLGEFKGWSAITMLIGGSPCSDITASNRKRTYLEGAQSSLFKYYAQAVKNIHTAGKL